jgi:hypothetical protein
MSDDINKQRIADDLLWGAASIGEEIGRTEAEVYNLHRAKRIPIGKCGKTLIASRKALKRALLPGTP